MNTTGEGPADRRRLPLRAYIVGLVVVFVAAVAAATLYQRSAALDDARRAAADDARFGAALAAREIREALDGASTTVQRTAAHPSIARVFDAPAGCTLTFGGAGPFTVGRLDIVSSDGSVACTSQTRGGATSHQGAGWLADALRGPTVAGPVPDPITGRQAVVVAVAIQDRGVLAAVLDLESLGTGLAKDLGGPRRLGFRVTGADGRTALSMSLDARAWRGDELIQGTATVPGLGWEIRAGADRAAALAGVDRLLRRELAISGAGLLVFLLAAWVIHRRISRPVQRLSARVRAAGTSSSPAVPAVAGPAEIAALSEDFERLMAVEAERRELAERLQRSQRLESLGQLAGGIAHDFNNLLGVILNYATFAAEQLPDNPEVRADIEEIRAAAERAVRLTRRLLIVGRRESAQSEPLDLDAVVADIEPLLTRTLGERVEVAVHSAGDLLAIRADRGQVEQVLLNLAVNARDAMPEGGTLAIATRSVDLDDEARLLQPALDPGRYVELAVTDTGTGMPPEVLDHLFEPFFTTKPAGEGTGLGLATVYAVVTEAGGSLRVRSEPGGGTTFRVYFPVVGAVQPPTSSKAGPEATRPDGRGETVLVVEDEAAVLAMASRMLGRHGYTVLEATTWEAALVLAEAHPIDLLLTDSVMPQVSGRDLSVRIRELRPTAAVLLMSGFDHSKADQDIPFVQKPFVEETLLDAVRSALEASPGR